MMSAQQLSLVHDVDTLEDFQLGSAFSGTQLLYPLRRVYKDRHPFKYFEFRTLCTLMEALVLYDKIYLLGPVEGPIRDNFERLCDDFSGEASSPVIEIVAGQRLEQLVIGNRAIGRELQALTDQTFPKPPTLTARRLMYKSPTGRLAQDYRDEILKKVDDLFSGEVMDSINLATFFFREWISDDEEKLTTIHFLFRLLLYGAVASIHHGTLINGGFREVFEIIMRDRLAYRFPADVLTKLYDSANFAYRNVFTGLAGSRGNGVFLRLIPAYLIPRCQTRSDLIIETKSLRTEFAELRHRFADISQKLYSENTTLKTLKETSNSAEELAVGFLADLSQTYGLGSGPIWSAVKTFGKKSFEALAPATKSKFDLGGEGGDQSHLDLNGKILLGEINAIVEAYKKGKRDAFLKPLKNVADKVLNAKPPNLLPVFPIDDLEDPHVKLMESILRKGAWSQVCSK